VGFYNTPGYAYGVYVSGSLAYVADGSSGLRVIDVSSPENPFEVGFYDTPDWALGVYVSGNYAYVADDDYGLRVIDVSSPENPREVGFYDTPGYAFGVYISGSYAYVADDDYGLRVIDVSSPSNPFEVDFYDTPGIAFGVYVSGSYAYVADGYYGLRVIDVSSPSNPFEVGFYDTPCYAYGVYVSGGLIYVADTDGGLYILRYTGGGEPFYGDVSGNGEITAFDASLILRVVVGILNLGDTEYLTLYRADVSGNGTVSALDAALVLQYTVGLITEFPCQRPASAPALDQSKEAQLLTKAINELEAVHLSKEGERVLESLKRFVATQAGSDARPYTALFQNFPNPFNPDAWIPYQIAKDASVTIKIYNVKGQLIRTLELGEQKAGVYVRKDRAAYWDGRDDKGEKVASGVYFYTLRTSDFTATRKMVILK
jgi:hypothetical protein